MVDRRIYRPFTPEEDARMVEMRLGAPGNAGIETIAAALGRRPATITNRLALLGRRDVALGAKLDAMRRRPRAEPDVHPAIATLRARRRTLGLSRPQLGKITGYATDTIECWERGKTAPRMDALVNWAQALGVEIVAQETGV